MIGGASSDAIASSDAAVASEVLDQVRAAGPAEAEVTVDRTEYAVTRFANSYIHQNIAATEVSVTLRLHLDGRSATGSTSVSDRSTLRELVARTIAAARLCPPDPQWPGLAPPARVPSAAAVDAQTAAGDPQARAARVRDFVAATEELEAAGYCSTVRWSQTFANSAGQAAWAEAAQAALDGIARAATSDGLARLAAARVADLDGGLLGARAAAKARAGAHPRELPPGRYEVVLEPTAVADLVTFIAYFGLNGKAVNERRSFIELGSAQFDPALTLVDDPFAAGSCALPFDIEGTPRRRLAFIDAGRTAAVAHDRRTAAQAGADSTGHALPGGAAMGAVPAAPHLLPTVSLLSASGIVPGESVSGLVPGESVSGLVPGEVDGPAADASVAALVAQVERGLLVTDNWYTRVLDPRTLVVTGLTRNGVWLIENGRITHPVQNLRFTQSYPEALGPGAVLGVGSQAVALPDSWSGRTVAHAPALRLRSWNFTGNASG